MKDLPVPFYIRKCTKCREYKPIRGAITSPRFICKDCVRGKRP